MTHKVHTYTLTLNKKDKDTKVLIHAHDSNHAQAQSNDICRAVEADKFNLCYETTSETQISKLYKRLAFNDFTCGSCVEWEGSMCNKNPCFYLLGKRIYVKHSIIKYLDIPLDSTVKNTCKNKRCINPYHFVYVPEKNSKITSGELKLLVAYRSQGTDVGQIAEAFNVHRSTIYRKLKDEHFSVGSSSHRYGSRR